MSQKSQTRKIWNYIKSSCIIFCAKMTRYSQNFFELYQGFVAKRSNTSILYTTHALKALLRKNWFNFFFLMLCMQKFHHFLGCHTTSIDSSFNSFLSALPKV